MRDIARIVVLFTLAAAIGASPVVADNGGSIPLAPRDMAARASGERAPGSYDAAAFAAEMRTKSARLQAAELAEAISTPLVVPFTRDDELAIERGDLEERRYRVGITKAIDATIDLAGVDLDGSKKVRRLELGAVRATPDGWVWSAAISAPGATALRLHFKNFNLPEGSEMWVYSHHGEAFGPYIEVGPQRTEEFWSHTVSGSEVLLQLRHRGTKDALAATYFEIDGVGSLGDRFHLGQLRRASLGAEKTLCPANEDCVENAGCWGGSEVAEARDAVAYMLFQSGRYWYLCSGGLLADSDPATQIPYFLTANHCISKGREAATLETTFFFAIACNGDCSVQPSPSTIGASIVSTSRTSDYTLLQLNQNAPGGAAFLGWDNTPVAFADGTHLYRISHPAGSPQAYSEHDVDRSKGTCTTWPRGDWIYSQDAFGATEGGSSGSPVVNGAGEVVGQLSGACGTNVYDTCDSVSNATVDGAFAAYYSEVAPWLDGGGSSCSDADGDGFEDALCGGDDCNDGDPSINPGAIEICDDGIDNDCDGDFDAADTDCGGSCLPKGSACSTNADCCSNKCRGRNTRLCR